MSNAHSHAAGQYIVLAQGPYTSTAAGIALPDVDMDPLLGPMGGGTTVMLQVHLH